MAPPHARTSARPARPARPEPARACRPERECRCRCGSLMARIVGEGVELRCRRCKRTLLVPWSAREGWAPLREAEAEIPGAAPIEGVA